MTQTGGAPANPIVKDWWASKTFWTSAAGVVTAGGAILALILRDQKWAVGAASLAALLGNLGSWFAKSGGTEAAIEVGARAGVLTPEEAAAVPTVNQPNSEPPVS